MKKKINDSNTFSSPANIRNNFKKDQKCLKINTTKN